MSTTLITSRDPKGLQFMSLCEAVYNKAKLDESRAQHLNENGGELTAGLKKLVEQLSVSNQFANEEVRSSYGYPKGYRVRPIAEQVERIAKLFDLNPEPAYAFARNLPELPGGAEGWFANPSVEAVAKKHFLEITDESEKYCRATQLVLQKIGESRMFCNKRDGEILAGRFRLNARTAHALDILAQQQKGDIWIVGGQFGKRHAGRSVRRAREVMVGPEFGGYTVAAGSILLVHPERLVSYDDLWMDLPGDEFAPGADGKFSSAPCFRFDDGEVGFGTDGVGDVHDHYGSVSFFLPQF